MASSFLVLALAVVAAFAVAGVHADATAESVLSCSPLRVEPGQNVSCIIYVRDSLQDLTTKFSVSDFTVLPMAVVSGTVLTTSKPAVGLDLTSIVFTVSAATGTNIAINVYLTQTAVAIRGSGVTASVLVWPATRLGNISCTTANYNADGALPLRATTTCTTNAYGANNLAAVVRPGDIYLTEDHFAGTFLFVSGSVELVFTYTAPSTIVSTFDAFKLRVTLSTSNVLYSISIPMAYPTIAASSLSFLQCTGVLRTTCYISARDNIGPVFYQPSYFTVSFEGLNDATSQWTTSTNQFNVSLTAGATTNIEQVSWALINNNVISTQRVRAYLVTPATTAGSATTTTEIQGSPFVFTSGVTPTSSTVSFRGCNDKYVAIGNTTTCTLDLLDGVTGDPRYYTLSSAAGGKFSALVYTAVDPSGVGTPIMTFTYTASSSISTRTDDAVSVSVTGAGVLNSPRRVIVYVPAAAVVSEESTENRPGLIAIGMAFFGSCLSAGGVFFWRRQQRIHRVQLARLAREREELKKMGHNGVEESHHTFATAHGGSFADSAYGSRTASFDGGDKAPAAAAATAAATAAVVGGSLGSTPSGVGAAILLTRDILGDVGRPRSNSTSSSTTGKSDKSDE